MKGYLKKLLVTSFIVMLAISVVSCGDNRNIRAKVTPVTGTPAPEVSSSLDSIAVNGTLVPARQIKLGFQVSGQVKEIAEIGDMVVAGQVVARLDDTRLKWSVEEAQLKLKQAELELEKAQKLADPDELAAAEKAIQAAQAVLANAHSSVPTTTDLAQNALRTAQLIYDRAERDHKHLLDMKGWGYDVEDELKSSQLQLDNARTDLDIARRNASGASVRASESVIQAQQTLAEAQARYAALKKQPDPDNVKAAQLSVEAARLALQKAQTDLAQVELTAPYTGTVTALMIRQAEMATAGAPVLGLADTTRWRVETSNMSELQIAKMQVGQKALVTVNAFLGQELAGRVIMISPVAIVQQGDTTYTITIELGETNLPLRWGMTAKVRILV
jgi:HlyD family secretion protein